MRCTLPLLACIALLVSGCGHVPQRGFLTRALLGPESSNEQYVATSTNLQNASDEAICKMDPSNAAVARERSRRNLGDCNLSYRYCVARGYTPGTSPFQLCRESIDDPQR